MKFILARKHDVPGLVALRTAAAGALIKKYGPGFWGDCPSERWILFTMRQGEVLAGWRNQRIVATFTLQTKKPWSIDRSLFSKVNKPLYLTAMAVAPDLQRRGLGRACIDQARAECRRQGADALFLDAYDAPAGAGTFYRKAGFRKVGSGVYRTVPLMYYEMLLEAPNPKSKRANQSKRKTVKFNKP
jgi:GNAT superfamily N-acetyltransferase